MKLLSLMVTKCTCLKLDIVLEILKRIMMNTGILTKDLGTILVGRQAVEEGLIDSIGGIHEAFAKLHQLIHEAKSCGKKSF